jgi:hypothetical protein
MLLDKPQIHYASARCGHVMEAVNPMSVAAAPTVANDVENQANSRREGKGFAKPAGY